MRKRILSWLLVVTLALTLFPTAAFAQQAPIENGLWLTPESHTLNLYEASMGTVTGTFYEGAAIKHAEDGLDMVTWEVGDSSVIHLDKTGTDSEEAVTVWALKEGQTTITARSEGYTETINVTVAAPIRLTMEEPNNMTTLTAPDLVDGSKVTPNDPSVVLAEAQDGVGVTLTAVAPGTTTITVVEPSGTTYDIPVYVDYDQVYWDIDGVLTASTHRVGTVPTYPGAAPTKAGIPNRVYYDFSGWDPEPAKVTSGEGPIYTAQFNERIIYELESDDFTIYVGGDSANAEDLSRHVGYYATDDTRVTGFPENTTVVSDAEDIVSVEQQGDTWIATPHAAGRAALTATYSDGQYSSDVTFYVTVENSEGYHTITFNVPGKGVERQVVKDGDTPVPTISTDRDTDYNASYTFTGWQPEIGPVTADTTFVAQYDVERIQYTVLFKDWDGTTLKEQTCYFGDTPTAPADPTRPVDATYCYTFTGWDNDNTSVDGTLGTTITYTATYSAIPRSEVSYTLEMSDDMLRLPTEETHTLTVETTPYAGMQQSKFTWSVDDPETVTILSEAEDGSLVEIKGVKPGSTTVRVTDGNESAACSVTVGERTFTITWVTDAENNLSFEEDCAEGETPTYKPNSGIPTKAADNTYYYVFREWSPTPVPCTGDATYTAIYDRHRLVELSIEPEAMALVLNEGRNTGAINAEVTPDDVTTEITFSSSNENVATVDEDGNVTAVGVGVCSIIVKAGNQTKTCRVTVTAPKATIKWYDDPENLLHYTESTVSKGATPVYPLNGGTPVKEETDQYTWTFDGWEPTITPANEDQSYRAKFTRTVKQYTVTWDDAQGHITTETYDYGEVFTKPANPTKPDDAKNTYEFMGWKETTNGKLNDPYEVVKNLYFTAQFNVTQKKTLYIVEKENGSYRTSMNVGDYQQLSDFAYPASITRKWKSSAPAVASINDDGYIQAKSAGKTTISIESTDGKFIDSFELTVSVLQFTVTWSVNGYITEENYDRGATPVFKGSTDRIPSNTTVYTFIGWDKELVPVAGDITYTAVYSETARKYTVTWNNDGTITQQEYLYNETPYYQGETTKPSTDSKNYIFTGWEPALAPVTEDVTYTAQYEEEDKLCTITWVVDGVETQSLCAYGRVPVYPGGTPTKAPTATTIYTFSRWNTPIVAVTGPATYVAQFTEATRKYAVTWVVNGARSTEEYEYNTTPRYRGNTERAQTPQYTYTFTGWSPEIAPVTEDVTYTAQYNEVLRKYTILFKNWDGSTIKSMLLEYGATPDVSTLKPTRADTTENGKTTKYKFKGWNPDITMVTKDATYTATYNATTKGDLNDPELAKKEFNISFVNWDGKVLETVKVKGGTKPAYSGKTPTRESTKDYRYTFAGWYPEIVEATEDATYTAQFKQSSAQTVVLTENDLAEAAKNPMTTIRFPYGILYINQDGVKELQAIKAQITIEVVKKGSNGDMLTIRFLKGVDETLITADMDGLLFLANYMDSGDVVALADDDKTKDSDFASVIFSVINQAGAYVPIPGSCSIRTESTYVRFDDLLGSGWAKGYIDFCSARSLVDGFGDYKFQPESTITRAQAATIAHRLFGSPKPYGGKAYDDVSPFEWYAASISWATGNNLIDGLADTQFSPNTGITRADQVLLLYKMARLMNYECKERGKLARFHDAGLLKTGDQTTAMEWAVATGIIEGTTNVTLSPRNPTTRAEFCAMMYRFISYLTIWDDSKAVEFN